MHTLARPPIRSRACRTAVVLLACLAGAARAEETDRPARELPTVPRRSHLQSVAEIAAPRPLPAALGLRLTRASAVLRHQLGIERGAGLVVEEIAPGSPAALAGFERHDVIVMLDDQMLVLPEQFAALVEAGAGRAAGSCTLLRAGRRVVIPLEEAKPVVAQARPAAETRVSAAAQPVATVVATPPQPGRRDPPGLRPTASSLALARPAAAGEAGVQPAAFAAETLVREDADCLIRLERGDCTRVVVCDPGGRVLFDGPIDTPEERSRMPLAFRDRVEAMERRLETAAPGHGPVAEIGRLDVNPVDLR